MSRSKVAILETSPATVIRHYHDLLNLAGYQEVLPKRVDTDKFLCLNDAYRDGFLIPKRFIGENIVHLPGILESFELCALHGLT